MSDTVSGPQPSPPTPGGPAPGGPPGAGAGPPPGFPGQRMTPGRPGPGTHAAALMKLNDAVKLIQEAMMSLPIGSDAHKAANKAVRDLSAHVAGQSQATQGIGQTSAQDLVRAAMQNAMRNKVAQNQGGPPGQPPSLPLPGA